MCYYLIWRSCSRVKFKRALLPVYIISLLIVLISCGDSSLFFPEVEERSVAIDTVEAGTVLGEGEAIPVALRYPASYSGDEADRVLLVLSDADGEEAGRYEYGPEILKKETLPSISIPEGSSLKEGLYTLSITVYSGSTVLSEKTVDFFFTGGFYGILGLSSYPPRLFPGASGLLKAHLDYPSDSDPYLRWKLGDQVLAEGLLSKGFDEITITSPEEEGVYSLLLELFPVQPEFPGEFDFASSISMGSRIFVSRSRTFGEYELSPEESYYSLFHFRGNLRDTGQRSRNDKSAGGNEIKAAGDPRLKLESDVFGYYFDGRSGIEAAGLLLPRRDGRLSPFSLNFRFLLDEIPVNGRFFESRAGDNFRIYLGTDAAGIPVLDIDTEDESFRISSGFRDLPVGRAASLSLSVSPGDNMTIYMWFVDGFPVAVVEDSRLLFEKPLDSEKNSVSFLGGTEDVKGFRGIIDEFGVYFRDSERRPAIDSGVFKAAMSARYGNRLVYAEGFEGLFLPKALRIEGSVLVVSGELIINPGSRVWFPDFLFYGEELKVEIAVGENADEYSGDIRFYEASAGEAAGGDERLFSVTTTGDVYDREGPAGSAERAGSEPVKISLLREGSGLTAQINGSMYAFALHSSSFNGVQMELNQPRELPVALKIEHVLSWKENSSLEEDLDLSSASGNE